MTQASSPRTQAQEGGWFLTQAGQRQVETVLSPTGDYGLSMQTSKYFYVFENETQLFI